jgi:site-specific DNA-methyltransferase (adenine-specific)
MGQKWDSDVPSVEIWTECLRVLKPGGYLLAFAGARTQHRMAVRIEDAGFEIRDMIAWVYGSGFPKSRNIANDMQDADDAAAWSGWGTALKPALEPITVARKPLVGTVAANVLEHGTGALNIDACRVNPGEAVPGGGGLKGGATSRHEGWQRPAHVANEATQPHNAGRWPANLIHDGSDEVLAAFPQANGQQGSVSGAEPSSKTANAFGEFAGRAPSDPRGDTGSAARFFYCAKASKKDRGEGNKHPTVKPTDLMAYLCRLVTPPDGVVLDPFMGSGSTGKAAQREGFRFIGIERDPQYFAIARARLEADNDNQRKLDLA